MITIILKNVAYFCKKWAPLWGSVLLSDILSPLQGQRALVRPCLPTWRSRPWQTHAGSSGKQLLEQVFQGQMEWKGLISACPAPALKLTNQMRQKKRKKKGGREKPGVLLSWIFLHMEANIGAQNKSFFQIEMKEWKYERQREEWQRKREWEGKRMNDFKSL